MSVVKTLSMIACLSLGCRSESRTPHTAAPVLVAVDDSILAPPEGSNARPEDYCVPRAQARLLGLGTFIDEQVARNALGPPIATDSGSGEDDGGEYSTTISRYAQLLLETDNRGFGIERIETWDSTVPLPSGARVGMRIAEVQDLLNAPASQRGLARSGWEAMVCSDPGNERVEVRVDSAGVVTAIALTLYGP